jgi:hypothetical protein
VHLTNEGLPPSNFKYTEQTHFRPGKYYRVYPIYKHIKHFYILRMIHAIIFVYLATSRKIVTTKFVSKKRELGYRKKYIH